MKQKDYCLRAFWSNRSLWDQSRSKSETYGKKLAHMTVGMSSLKFIGQVVNLGRISSAFMT